MRILVQATGRFSLASFGGGISYLLSDHLRGRSAHMQGDDAISFECQRGEAERRFPDADDQFIIGWLWDQCGYGEASAPFEPEYMVA